MQKTAKTSRIDALDVARGIALIAMATYHFSWDLELFGYIAAGTAGSGFLKYYARAIASSFLFIVGFSLVLATLTGVKWRPFIWRLVQVGASALVISAATFYATPDGWIFFGILHHIFVASVIGLVFIRLPWAVVAFAAITAFALPWFGFIVTQSPWLSFLGLFATPPNSNDFVPLFPWLSASLAGIAVAKLVISNGWIESLAKPKALNAPARQLKYLGQHSLAFYLLHQPVLIALVWIVSQILPPNHNSSDLAFDLECQSVCEKQFSAAQCQTYCNCFEIELKDNAAQWSQLPAQDQSKAISLKCTQVMQETSNP